MPIKYKLRAYTAAVMSGQPSIEVLERAQNAICVLSQYGIQALDPVTTEGVKPSKKKIDTPYKQMIHHWQRDKQMIREAHVVIDLTPTFKSEGVQHELGYARYFLYKPIIRVFPEWYDLSKGSIAYFEDDVVAFGLIDAAQKIVKHWGTPWKRFVWRFKLLKCVPQAIVFKLKEWWIF